MDYKKDMDKCRNYIEEHIGEKITPRSLAGLLGYSFYHFCHVFRICNDMPVGEYLRRRRLLLAVEALKSGRRITDIALELGFDTAAGFSKAFRREFGISASQYRRHMYRQINYEQLYEQKGEGIMKVTMTQKDGFKAVCYSIAPKDGQEIDIIKAGAYWLGSDFSSVSQEDYAKLAKGGADQIGMWYHPEEDSGNLSYLLGPVVDNFDYIPLGMVTVEIPAADYAVFTTDPSDLANDKEAFSQEIKKTWKYIFEEWFEENDYIYDQKKFAFEFYTDKNGGIDSTQAVTDIYIPVQKK